MTCIFRRFFSLLIFSLLSGATITSLAQERPNVILIMADDLGYGDLGCYGQQKIKTPHLDALAAAGLRFTDFYAGSTVCSPSREALLTGMHTGHTFIRGNFNTGDSIADLTIPDETVTIAQYLKKADYQTAIIGKWGVGGPGHGPNEHGFDYSLCYLDQIKAHNYYPAYLWENEEVLKLKGNEGGQQGTYSHHVFADKTLEYIRQAKENNPFFLYLPYTVPHGEHVIPDDAPYTSEDWPQNAKNYAAMITLLDQDVGRIVQELENKGIADNTIIFFTSDNGANPAFAKFFQSNGALRGAKRDLYEGGIREPLIAYWPGHIEAGRESAHIAAAWDFSPTICQLAGVTVSDTIDGISLLPALLGKEQQEHPFLYWEYYGYNWNWGKPGNTALRNQLESRAARFGKWKAVQKGNFANDSSSIELYNLEVDVSETDNLSSEHPEIVAKARDYFESGSSSGSPYFPFQP